MPYIPSETNIQNLAWESTHNYLLGPYLKSWKQKILQLKPQSINESLSIFSSHTLRFLDSNKTANINFFFKVKKE